MNSLPRVGRARIIGNRRIIVSRIRGREKPLEGATVAAALDRPPRPFY